MELASKLMGGIDDAVGQPCGKDVNRASAPLRLTSSPAEDDRG